MVLTPAEIRQNIALANALYQQGDYAQAGAMYGDLFLEPAMHDHEDVRGIHWSYALCLHHEGQDDPGGLSDADFDHQMAEAGLHPPH